MVMDKKKQARLSHRPNRERKRLLDSAPPDKKAEVKLNVSEFLEDREKRIMDAWRRLRGIPNR